MFAFSQARNLLGLASNNFPYVKVRTLEWSEIKKWMAGPGDPGNLERGYIGGHLENMDGWSVTVRREYKGDRWQTTASLIRDRRIGSVASQTWISKNIGSDLNIRFGQADAFSFVR